MTNGDAVTVSHARKRYGSDNPILDGLNMTVPRGTIYGLLGASGCGKSTLLSCIVGVKHLDSGDIWVLGGQPGSKNSGIPGPRVGYMPQEISLVEEFSVMGALYYFGRINGMKDSDIDDEYYFLSDLLHLPPKNRLIKNMSGGQQRRVSFAAALLHKPELLILDEPTVGLDPILREKIWNFLVKITQEQNTTVIITTHYIEEARLANKIGLMRCGRLLAEAPPSHLLDRFQCPTLEEAFLILSQKQQENQTQCVTNYISADDISATIVTSQTECINRHNFCVPKKEAYYDSKEYTQKPVRRSTCLKRFQALMIKNLLQFIRHPGGVIFAMMFPIIQTTVFFYAVGGDPKDLSIGIVNYEAGNCDFGLNKGQVLIVNPELKMCDFIDLSCRFIDTIDDSFLKKVYYNNTNTIKDDVKHRKISGYIYFSQNFSKSLQKKLDSPMEVTTAEIEDGEMQITLDMGDRQTGLFLQKEFYERYEKAMEQILSDCGIAPRYYSSPVYLEKPLFGDFNLDFSSFMAPTYILTVIFFVATSVTSSIIITDRYEGVWYRSIVQGVHTAEILLAHILTQALVIVLQVAVALIISFVQFNLQCLGSMTAVIVLVFLTGLCGMCYGLFISVMCSSHTMAHYMTTGTFFPLILLCGCIWPIEGMPSFLQWLSLCLPTTIPGLSLRSILSKGYPFNDPQVYNGFIVVSGWTAGLVTLCLIGLKTKTQ